MWRIRSINRREKGTRRQKKQKISYSHEQKQGRIKGIVGVVLLGVMMGLGGCGGMGGAGWGNPDICEPGQFAGDPRVMMVDDVLMLEGQRMRARYGLQGNDGKVLWRYRTGWW